MTQERKVHHRDIRFAGTSDEDLRTMAEEYEAWCRDASLPDDALLRGKARGMGPWPMSGAAAALLVFREMAQRAGLYRFDEAP